MTVLSEVRARPLVRAVPAWAWLTGIVVCSAAVQFAVARRMVAPWIMVDELIYSDLARSFAATGHFLLRGEATGGYGIVYPALVSPAWRLTSSGTAAYELAKGLNAILFSLAAVPAYLLARRVVSQRLALVAALLTVAVPSALYVGTIMTENAFYPATLLFALALVAALERPTALRAVLVLAAFGLAFETRAQAAAFLGAALVAPLLVGGLRRFMRYYAVLLGPVVLAVVVEAVRGRSPKALLGAYAAATGSSYAPGPVLKWLAYHAIELDLYVGVVPVVALVVLAARRRSLDPRARAFLAAAVSLTVLLVVEVAIFAAGNAGRIEERNMFYVAPLLSIALLAWIEQGLPRTRLALGAGIVCALAPLALPVGSLIGVASAADTLQADLWWRLVDAGFSPWEVRAALALGAVLAVALALWVPRRLAAPLVPAVLVLWFAGTAVAVDTGPNGIHHQSVGALFQGIAKPDRTWVDDAVGRGADVAALHVDAQNRDAFAVWENEFFNRSVRRVYDVGVGPLPGGLPETQLRVDRANGLLLEAGKPVRVPYALAASGYPLVGKALARDPVRATTLYRPAGPLRVSYTTTGLYPDTWSGPRVVWHGYACGGGTLRVHVAQDPSLFTTPQTVTAAGRTWTVRGDRWLSVPLHASGGTCRVVFTVSPTKVPGPQDSRRLGLRFEQFSR